jgi:hypothetical protein
VLPSKFAEGRAFYATPSHRPASAGRRPPHWSVLGHSHVMPTGNRYTQIIDEIA